MADEIVSALFGVKQARTLICKQCGEECERTGQRQFYCSACKAQRKLRQSKANAAKYNLAKGNNVTGLTLTCAVCSTSFIARQGGNKYCSRECRRSYELSRHHERTRDSGIKKVGDVIVCSDCGCDMYFLGGSHKRCEGCLAANAAVRQKKYRSDHPDRIRARESIPRNRLDKSFSRAIASSLRGAKAGAEWETLVGYGVAELLERLESLFQPGMSLENYGQWHIDHIVPKSVFNYESPDHIDFKRCWSLSNLQPLWALDNIKKSDKLFGSFQPSLAL